MIASELNPINLVRLRRVCKSLKHGADRILWSHAVLQLEYDSGPESSGGDTVVRFHCPRTDRLPSLPCSQWELGQPIPSQLAFIRVLDSFGEGNWDDNDDEEEPGGPQFTALAAGNAFPNLEMIRFPIEHPYGRQPVPFRAKTAVVFTMWSTDATEIEIGPYCALPPAIEELIIHSTNVRNGEDPETTLNPSEYPTELRRVVLIVQPLDDIDRENHGGDDCQRCKGPCDAIWWDPEEDWREPCDEVDERLAASGGWVSHIFDPKHFAAALGEVEYVIVGHRTRHDPESAVNAEFELKAAQKMRDMIEESLDEDDIAKVTGEAGSVKDAVSRALRFQSIGDYRADIGDEKFLLHTLQTNFALQYPDLGNKHYKLAWGNHLDNQSFGFDDFP